MYVYLYLVTLGYFDDILITPESLQFPSKFDEREQIWTWEYRTEDDEIHEMPMEKNSSIRFRITGETFNDTTPVLDNVAIISSNNSKSDLQANSVQPGASKTSNLTSQTSGSGSEAGAPKKIPYFLTGSINEPGLGLASWWS